MFERIQRCQKAVETDERASAKTQAMRWRAATIIEREEKYTVRFRESVDLATITAAPSLGTSVCTDSLLRCCKDKE
jgi:hypothetical protein